MKVIDRDGLRLCKFQAELFETSVSKLLMSSEVFVRRFMNSNVVMELDNLSFLDDSKTIDDIFDDLNYQYGETTYGSVKYDKDVMHWCGYIYRYFSYTYDILSKQVYKLLPLKYLIKCFSKYHTLEPNVAIVKILEEKNISFDDNDRIQRSLEIMRRIRKECK